MKESKPEQTSDWEKSPTANLFRYQPSGNYFACARVGRKIIRKTFHAQPAAINHVLHLEGTNSYGNRLKNNATGRIIFTEDGAIWVRTPEALARYQGGQGLVFTNLWRDAKFEGGPVAMSGRPRAMARSPVGKAPNSFPNHTVVSACARTRKTRVQITVQHRSASFQHVLLGGTSFRFFLAVDQTYDSLSISPSCAFSRGPRDSPPSGWSRGRTAPDSRYRPCPLSRGRFPLRSGWRA